MLGWKSSSHRNQYSQTSFHTSEAYCPMEYHLMSVLDHFIQNTHPRVPQKSRHVQQRTETRREKTAQNRTKKAKWFRGISKQPPQCPAFEASLIGTVSRSRRARIGQIGDGAVYRGRIRRRSPQDADRCHLNIRVENIGTRCGGV